MPEQFEVSRKREVFTTRMTYEFSKIERVIHMHRSEMFALSCKICKYRYQELVGHTDCVKKNLKIIPSILNKDFKIVTTCYLCKDANSELAWFLGIASQDCITNTFTLKENELTQYT